MGLMNWLGIGKTAKGEEHLRRAAEIIDRDVNRSEYGAVVATSFDLGTISSIETELQAALQSDPTNPEYKYLVAAARINKMQGKEALDDIRRIAFEHPDFAEAEGYLANNGEWFTPLLYPPWEQSRTSVPESIIPADSKGCLLTIVRDRCRRVVSFFTRLPERSLGHRFNPSLRTAVRFHFEQTPFAPVVGAYVLIDTHPTEPYTSETILSLQRSHAGWPDQARCGYWLLRLLAQQKYTFIVFAEPSGGPVYFNRRVEFDGKAIANLRDVTTKMARLDASASGGRFDLAKSHYSQSVSLDAITF